MEPITKRKKGVALLWTMVICFVLLIISGTMAGYIIKDSQSSLRIEDSTQAYAAAKSGIDWGVWYHKNNGLATTKTFTLNGALVTVVFSPTGIDSTGEINGVRRKIHYTYGTGTPISINPGNTLLPPTASSYKLQFDFWIKELGSAFQFGTQNTSGYPMAYMDTDNTGKVKLVVKTSATEAFESGTIDLSTDTQHGDAFRYRVVIKYIKKISATIEISRREIGADPNDATKTIETFSPVGSQSIDLIGKNLGDQNKLYISTPNNYVSGGGTEGDREYLELNNTTPTTASYIDHITLNNGSSALQPTPVIMATGGEITYLTSTGTSSPTPVAGGYTVHTFKSSGAFSINVTATVDVLVVGGGGGGGSSSNVNVGGGGGGGGGFLETFSLLLPAKIHPVTVGGGGLSGSVGGGNGSNGDNSSFYSLIASGGGGGAYIAGYNTSANGLIGGSGGGGRGSLSVGGYGVTGQGNYGGGGTNYYGGGGGGGAGSPGFSATFLDAVTTRGGSGGTRKNSLVLPGSSFAGGGGGSGWNYGFGGCGTNNSGGANGTVYGISGLPNTGCGGGGAGPYYNLGTGVGGAGGSGIVIIRYRTP